MQVDKLHSTDYLAPRPFQDDSFMPVSYTLWYQFSRGLQITLDEPTMLESAKQQKHGKVRRTIQIGGIAFGWTDWRPFCSGHVSISKVQTKHHFFKSTTHELYPSAVFWMQ